MRVMTWMLVSVGAVLLVASWSVAGNRTGRPIQESANAGETGTPSSLLAQLDQDVLFGTYLCRVEPGFLMKLTASFSSTGDLVPAPTAGVGDGGIVFFFETFKTENQLLGDATFARCESLASNVEQWLQEVGCTMSEREGSSTPNELIGLRYVCQGPRHRLIHIIGTIGRRVLGATL